MIGISQFLCKLYIFLGIFSHILHHDGNRCIRKSTHIKGKNKDLQFIDEFLRMKKTLCIILRIPWVLCVNFLYYMPTYFKCETIMNSRKRRNTY